MSGLFQINLKDVSGAVLSAVIVAILGYLGSLTSIYSVDWQTLLNVAVLAGIGSIVKALGTDENGKAFGSIQVK